MDIGNIYHRSTDNMCYAKNEDELSIQIRTGKDIDKIYLQYEDPMESEPFGEKWVWKGQRKEILNKKELKHHFIWVVTVTPPYKRCAYIFELFAGEEEFFFLEDGFYTPEEFHALDGRFQYFTFPWMNPVDICKPPEWVKDTIWYQIFPDRFCKKDETLPKPELKDWNSGNVNNTQYFGGDLPGITSKIPYLADLGITGIYLTPIFEASTTHKYDTVDYRHIDPAFGTEEDFRVLVDTAHEAGIKVMLDGVFNHCGYFFPFWQDVLQKGPDSSYWNWFMINQWPFDQKDYWTYDKKYYSFHFTAFMPKLNTNNEKVINYFTDICAYWAENFNIDGFRLDVAAELSHKFCRRLRERLKAINPDFFIMGEIWQDAMPWLRGDEFDSVMNYTLQKSLLHFWQYPADNKKDFEYRINQCYTMYMEQTNLTLFNLLDSHDTARLFTLLNEDEDSFFQILIVLFTLPGSPCIFYGTELAMPGGPDPDCRRCMPWEEIEAGKFDRITLKLKALISFRKNHSACRSSQIQFSDENDLPARVITYSRIDDTEKLTIRINADNQPVPIPGGQILLSSHINNNLLSHGGYAIVKEN